MIYVYKRIALLLRNNPHCKLCPDIVWNLNEIFNYLCLTESYTQAVLWSKKACETSNLDDTADEGGPKREIRKLVRYSSSEEESEGK